jgi:oligo-1,6-glucosidase
LAAWGRTGVVYQIYPKSFRDADGDGVGDLRGIIEKLDHVAALGADIVWLSPIFASPMVDNGYDVSDYCAVNPLFGTLDDFDELIVEAGRRGIRVLLDFALNHTSAAHPWFKAAEADPTGPYADYYIVRDGRGDDRPNNWRSVFGGPAWAPFPDGRWRLHLFDASQPDLNWDNPAVRRAIHAAMRFWLERGAGGFRLDVVTLISKPEGLPELPAGSLNARYRVLADGPHLKDYLREMRREVFAHFDCIAVGEAPGLDPARAAALVDPADPMLDMIYHFDLVEPPIEPGGGLSRTGFKRIFSSWDKGIGPKGWNSVVLGNHDLARLVSRFGDAEAHWRASATMLSTLTILQRATPFIYQGDEIGMTNTTFSSIEEIDDVWARNIFTLKRARGASVAEAFRAAHAATRDHARTPMQWNAAASAGFTQAAKPWLGVNQNAVWLTAAAQEGDGLSPLGFTRALIGLRRADPLWIEGATDDLAPDDPAVFLFSRTLAGRRGLVALNLTGDEAALPAALPEGPPRLCNYAEPGSSTALRPFEARVYAP